MGDGAIVTTLFGPKLAASDAENSGSPVFATSALDANKIICVGQNYRLHCLEMNSPLPENPVLFLKPFSSISLPDSPIVISEANGPVHHEIELAVCIGKRMTAVNVEDALEGVKGYSLGIDLTARDIQSDEKKRGVCWTLSKCQDGFAPIMNKLVPMKLVDLDNTEIWLEVDGVLKQKGNVNDMIFKIPHLIAYISKYITLIPGDFILTGTPSGVGPINNAKKIRIGMNSSFFSDADKLKYTEEFTVLSK